MSYAMAGKHSVCVHYYEPVLLCHVVNEALIIKPRASTGDLWQTSRSFTPVIVSLKLVNHYTSRIWLSSVVRKVNLG